MSHSTNGFFSMLMATIRLTRERRDSILREGELASHRWYTVVRSPYEEGTIEAEWWVEGLLAAREGHPEGEARDFHTIGEG